MTTILEDGTVRYRSSTENRCSPARRRATRPTLTPEDLAALRLAFEQAHFFDLSDRYPRGLDHELRVTISCTLGNRTKTVNYSLQADPPPTALRKLEAEINRIVGAQGR